MLKFIFNPDIKYFKAPWQVVMHKRTGTIKILKPVYMPPEMGSTFGMMHILLDKHYNKQIVGWDYMDKYYEFLGQADLYPQYCVYQFPSR